MKKSFGAPLRKRRTGGARRGFFILIVMLIVMCLLLAAVRPDCRRLNGGGAGAAVIIADLNPEWGGADYNGELIDNIPADKWIEQATRRLADMSNVSMLLRTTVQGITTTII